MVRGGVRQGAGCVHQQEAVAVRRVGPGWRGFRYFDQTEWLDSKYVISWTWVSGGDFPVTRRDVEIVPVVIQGGCAVKRSTTVISAILILLLASNVNPALAEKANSDSKDSINALKEAFNQKPRQVRSNHAMMPTTYIEYDQVLYYYVIPRRLQRLGESGEGFTIKKFRFKPDHVDMEIRSVSGAKLNVSIMSEQEMDQFFYDTIVQCVVRDLFEFRDPWSFQGVIANTQSRMVHLAGANHLPAPELREEFENLQEAEFAGFEPCTICFEPAHWIPMEGYFAARKAAIEAARTQEVIYPPVEDEAIQAELQQLGEKIVANFPVATMGFSYEFKVLHSELPWAQSFPTGFVFISDRLLGMIEDPWELEFILAHEIAHVELYFLGIDSESGIPPRSPFQDSAFKSYRGLLRAREMETDFTALVHLATAYRDSSVLGSALTALRKIQSYGEAVPARSSGLYDSHPTIRERTANLEDNFFIPRSSIQRFCDLYDDETVLTAEVMGVLRVDEGIRLVLLISANDLMNKAGKVPKNARIFDAGGKKYKLDRTGYPEYIGRNRCRIFHYDVDFTRFDDAEAIFENLGNISGLDLGNIGGASDWGVCSDLPND
ncbi:MAG: M48 family metalloprotease [Candidatus Krumholzibacteriota bacterium]